MKLIVGLGNPGKKYENNRHNLGFMVVDALVKQEGLDWKLSQDWVCYFTKSVNVVYAKPETFMNQSGVTVREIANFYKVDFADILVIYDEVDLPLGNLRLSFDGVSAGHRGVESLITELGAANFGRLRIGIGSPRKAQGEAGRPKPKAEDKVQSKADVSRYVLEDFSDEERRELPDIIKRASEAVRSYIADGIEATMNKFN